MWVWDYCIIVWMNCIIEYTMMKRYSNRLHVCLRLIAAIDMSMSFLLIFCFDIHLHFIRVIHLKKLNFHTMTCRKNFKTMLLTLWKSNIYNKRDCAFVFLLLNSTNRFSPWQSGKNEMMNKMFRKLQIDSKCCITCYHKKLSMH